MRKIFNIVIVIMAATVCISAQVREDRTRYADDKGTSLKLDIAEAFHPGTSYSYSVDDFNPGVVKVGPRTTYLKEGLRTDEVVRLLGKPTSRFERTENDIVITSYEFQRGEGHVLIAEFAGGVLVRSWTETRGTPPAQADR